MGTNDGMLTNGFVPVVLSTVAGAVAAGNPTEVSYQIPVAGNDSDYSYVYNYTGSGMQEATRTCISTCRPLYYQRLPDRPA